MYYCYQWCYLIKHKWRNIIHEFSCNDHSYSTKKSRFGLSISTKLVIYTTPTLDVKNCLLTQHDSNCYLALCFIFTSQTHLWVINFNPPGENVHVKWKGCSPKFLKRIPVRNQDSVFLAWLELFSSLRDTSFKTIHWLNTLKDTKKAPAMDILRFNTYMNGSYFFICSIKSPQWLISIAKKMR